MLPATLLCYVAVNFETFLHGGAVLGQTPVKFVLADGRGRFNLRMGWDGALEHDERSFARGLERSDDRV